MKDGIKSLLGMALFAFVCLCIDMYDSRLQMKEEAIKHGCAEYNQQTGKFQWIGGE